jgi:ribosomal protein S18 acetylase RimI-like enzyme
MIKCEFEDYSKVRDILCKDPIENAFMIYDTEAESPEVVEVYVDDLGKISGVMVVWSRMKIPTVMIRAKSTEAVREFVELLKNEEYIFVVPKSMGPMIKERFNITKEETHFLYYTDRNKFVKKLLHEVRPIEEGDAEEIFKFWVYGDDASFIREKIREGIFYGIYENEELVSFCGTLMKTKDVYAIGFVYTKEKYRGRGFGKSVVSAVADDIINEGRKPILYVVGSNAPAVRLYEGLGFSLYAEHTYWVGKIKA